jgi:hypothetical protein
VKRVVKAPLHRRSKKAALGSNRAFDLFRNELRKELEIAEMNLKLLGKSKESWRCLLPIVSKGSALDWDFNFFGDFERIFGRKDKDYKTEKAHEDAGAAKGWAMKVAVINETLKVKSLKRAYALGYLNRVADQNLFSLPLEKFMNTKRQAARGSKKMGSRSNFKNFLIEVIRTLGVQNDFRMFEKTVSLFRDICENNSEHPSFDQVSRLEKVHKIELREISLKFFSLHQLPVFGAAGVLLSLQETTPCKQSYYVEMQMR